MIQHHTVELNHVSLHYAEVPGPEPALVIIHGLTGSHAEFLHLVPELSELAHLYLLDLRGHGLSGHMKDGYLVADYAQDVAAFLRQVVGRPAILGGHSLGGLVAVWLAANAPDLLGGVFLVDPALYIIQQPRFGQSCFYPYFSGLCDYLKHYHANGASLAAMIDFVGQSSGDEAAATWERAIQLHQLDPTALDPALAGMLFGSNQPDELLARIQLPVHLIVAQASLGGAMTTQDVQRAISRLPQATYTVIEGAGHDIHLDQPEAFLHELKQFLTVNFSQVLPA
jgi:pimeloyl-ACP methyl ester carboxylesterase